jgi:hypothetical protein
MIIDFLLSAAPCAAGIAIMLFLLKINRKQYGLLMLLSTAAGISVCVLFVGLGLYSFPYRLFPSAFRFPILTLLTIFPAYSAAAVRYSPRRWIWKIPFYMTLVHLVTLMEAIAEEYTDIIRYGPRWNLWESYALWWAFLLAFEWLGGFIVSQEYRRPVRPESLRSGRPGWYVVHIVFMATIYLAGIYARARGYS